MQLLKQIGTGATAEDPHTKEMVHELGSASNLFI